MNTIYFTTLQKIVLVISFIGITLIGLGQKKHEKSFFTQMTEKETNLNSAQRQKLEIYRGNPVYKEVQLVKVGNLREQQNKGILTFQIPGRKGELIAKVTYVDLISESEYTWNGEFTGNDEGSIAILTKDGAVFGQMNIGTEAYSLKEGKNVLLQIDESTYSTHKCPGELESKKEEESKNSNRQYRRDCDDNCKKIVRVLVMYTGSAALAGNPHQDARVRALHGNKFLYN